MNRIRLGVLALAALACLLVYANSNPEYAGWSEDIIEVFSGSLISTDRPDAMKKQIIVFRDDDIGPDWSVGSAIYITDLFMSMNVSHVVGVVPANIDGKKLHEDAVLYEYLKSIKDDESIEFVLHGYDHSYHEFENIPLDGSFDSAASKISAGVNIIEYVVGVRPVAFVPPYGVYNENTLLVLKDTDSMYIMSACQSDIKNDRAFKEIDGILYLPTTTYFYNWDRKQYNTYEEVVDSCEHSISEYNICVIALHHHMFKDAHGNMDMGKVQVLIDVIEWAKSEEDEGSAKIMRMKDISSEDLK